MAYFPWAIELLLEALGAVLYRRRSKLLSFILGYCAFGDLILLAIFSSFHEAYAWAFWGYFALKYLFLCLLGCHICGMFVQERNKSQARIAAGVISLGTAAFVTVAYCSAETLKNSLLDGEIAANMVLLGIIALTWIGKRDNLTSSWKWITAGFLIMIGSDLLCTALWTFWDGARHWYPLGAISAQMVWVIGPLKSHRLAEARVSLGKKIPEAERVSVC